MKLCFVFFLGTFKGDSINIYVCIIGWGFFLRIIENHMTNETIK